jgi:hypothetical protein
LEELKAVLIKDRAELQTAIEFAKTQSGAYLDLIARQLVDAAMAIIIGHYFLCQAAKNDRKKKVAEVFITNNTPVIAMNCTKVKHGSMQVLTDYELLAGAVSVV